MTDRHGADDHGAGDGGSDGGGDGPPGDGAPRSESADARPAPEAAFSLLGNPTRVAILRALWEADEPRRFTALRRAVDVADTGQFNYHLQRLLDHYVRQADDEYELTSAGEFVVGAIVAGAIDQRPAYGTVAFDGTCPDCGTGLAARFEDVGTVYCPGCGRRYISDAFPSAGTADRTPTEMAHAFDRWVRHRNRLAREGVCPRCAGVLTTQVVTPGGDGDDGREGDDSDDDGRGGDDSDDDGRGGDDGDDDGRGGDDGDDDDEGSDRDSADDDADAALAVRAEHVCTNCCHETGLPLVLHAIDHPDVVGFFHGHGVDPQGVPYWELRPFLAAAETVVVAEEPFHARVTFHLDGDELAVEFDETLRPTVDGRED